MEPSAATNVAWDIAAAEAAGGGAPLIEPGHLVIGLCKVGTRTPPDASQEFRDDVAMLENALAGLGIDLVAHRRALRRRLARPRAGDRPQQISRTPASREAFRRAEQVARDSLDTRMRPVHLLTALLELGEFAGDAGPAALAATLPGADPVPPPRVQTPFLDHYGRDLTQLARDGGIEPVVGRRDEMRALARALVQQRKRSAVLIGEAGVGKTGVVEGLAQLLVGPEPPAELAGLRIVELQMAALVAGVSHRGDFEDRMQKLLAEAQADPSVILFIDEIHTLLGAGGDGASDAANIVKPALARGQIRVIGATTIDEYRRSFEKDPALQRRFEPVVVEEPTREQAIEILAGLRERFFAHHGIAVSDAAIEAAVDLSARYLPDRRLPDKAIDVIDQALAVARLATLTPTRRARAPAEIGREEVAGVISRRARVPVERLTATEAQRLLDLESELSARVMGQPEAVAAVAEAVRTARAGLKDPRRPAAVLLFAGPTGTGKTELARALAASLFDDESHLIRIDMSEYKEPHSVSRLVGAPPGYVGYREQEGMLTGAVRTRPHCVLLLDEIEKAHQEVLDLFLQVFDDGRLTDTRGREASFRDAVIILTSNLGAGAGQPARKPIGFASIAPAAAAAPAGAVEQALAERLRPELLNRIGRVVVFKPLDRAACRAIAARIVEGVRARLSDRRIELRLSDGAYDLLMDEGFDERFGGRELERAAQRLLVEPLSRALLGGEVADGATLHVDARDGRLEFTPE